MLFRARFQGQGMLRVQLLLPVVLLHGLYDLLSGVQASTFQLSSHVVNLSLRGSLLVVTRSKRVLVEKLANALRTINHTARPAATAV